MKKSDVKEGMLVVATSWGFCMKPDTIYEVMEHDPNDDGFLPIRIRKLDNQVDTWASYGDLRTAKDGDIVTLLSDRLKEDILDNLRDII